MGAIHDADAVYGSSVKFLFVCECSKVKKK